LDPHAVIGVFTDEPHPSYFRAALTNYLLGELREDQLFLNPPDFYETQRLGRAFTRVTHVDAARGEVWDSSSSTPTPFDALLIASGARPRTPPFEGGLLPGVATLRTLFDARCTLDALKLGGVAHATVLGGGALGLEWASALSERGVKVTLLERSPRLMMAALDEVASDLLAARLRQAGIELFLGEEVAFARPSPTGSVGGLMLKSGRELYTEFVAAALGVVPNTEFVQSAGLRLSKSGAVLVDRSLVSSAPNVWAAGDAANVDGEELALWEPARHQGRIAARNMLGGRMRYEPGAHYFATRLFDLDFARVGDIKDSPTRQTIVDFPRGTGKISYRKLVVEGGRLAGALMLGERSLRVRAAGRALKKLVDARADVTAIQDRIHSSNFDLSGWLEASRLLSQPAAGPKTMVEVAPGAKLKKTQHVKLASGAGTEALQAPRALAPQAPSAPIIGTQVLAAPSVALGGASPVRGTRLLSIGLPRVESAVEPRASSAPAAALERGAERVPLTRALTNLGRNPEADVRLSDPGAAGLHAQLVEHAGDFWVRDLGSQSGTWLNETPVSEARRLRDGDRLRLGNESLTFRSASRAESKTRTTALIRAPRILVKGGGRVGLALRLGEHPLGIGRDPSAALCLSDPGVAAQHARIARSNAGFVFEALTTQFGTWLRGQALPPGRAEPLRDGDWLRVGTVDLAYSEAAAEEAASALSIAARLSIDSGPNAGHGVPLPERSLIGSAEGSILRLPGLAPAELEIVRHGRGFFVRALGGARAMRAGRPLNDQWAALEHGDMLLVGGNNLLRFEET
jgi:NADPH-dependent 2,4-dienoyl-CoA reductase/sulfur reductase-like enzyme/pSer/pThr/pTyr-binding forkhead associated (FHA) protein